MEPYPMGFAFASLSSCLEDVPVEIRLWKPEHAPQATVMNNAGNKVPIPVFHPVNMGIVKVAVPVNAETKIPNKATIIIA